MNFHGSTSTNLASAIQSARRLSGRPIHSDTLTYWTDLLQHARREIAEGSSEPILELILTLEKQLAERAN